MIVEVGEPHIVREALERTVEELDAPAREPIANRGEARRITPHASRQAEVASGRQAAVPLEELQQATRDRRRVADGETIRSAVDPSVVPASGGDEAIALARRDEHAR